MTVVKYQKGRYDGTLHYITEPHDYHINQQIQITSALGYQTANLINFGYFTGAPPATLPLSPQVTDLFTEVFKITPAGYIPNSFNGTTLNSWKLFLEKTHTKTHLVNETPGTITIWCYDVVSKVSKSPYTNPATDFVAGLGGLQGSEGGVLVVDGAFPHTKPEYSKSFNINWKIVKKREIKLGQGDHWDHDFLFVPRRYVDTTYYTQFQQVRGITHGTFIVALGSIYDDKNNKDFNAASLTTGIGYTAVKIGGIMEQKITTRALDIRPRRYKYTTNLNVAGANQYILDQDEGGMDNANTVTEYM